LTTVKICPVRTYTWWLPWERSSAKPARKITRSTVGEPDPSGISPETFQIVGQTRHAGSVTGYGYTRNGFLPHLACAENLAVIKDATVRAVRMKASGRTTEGSCENGHGARSAKESQGMRGWCTSGSGDHHATRKSLRRCWSGSRGTNGRMRFCRRIRSSGSWSGRAGSSRRSSWAN